MKRLLHAILAVLTSRATAPVVMGLFLLVYIGIAFFTDETLVALIALTGKNFFLIALFALLPLNTAGRMLAETQRYLGRRRALAPAAAPAPELFDETVELPASADPAGLEERLQGAGYRTRKSQGALSAWRGFSSFPARLLYLAATFCLFAGILISLTMRSSLRSTVIEGEPILEDPGSAKVERIVLSESNGAILAKNLEIELSGAEPGDPSRVYGLYPPSRYQGAFLYPRYLGVGILLRFSAPDLQPGFQEFCVLNISRPGKEATQPIPGSPYRIVFSLASPEDGSDPYATGRMVFMFKLLKAKEVVLAGSAPVGGEFAKDGYLLQFPDARRVVITDLIRDYGVTLIWAAFAIYLAAALLWLPVRLLLPRREMHFRAGADSTSGYSRAEGGRRRHAGIFQETLDLLGAGSHGES